MLRRMIISAVVLVAALAGAAGTAQSDVRVNFGINLQAPPALVAVPDTQVMYAPSVRVLRLPQWRLVREPQAQRPLESPGARVRAPAHSHCSGTLLPARAG